MNIGNRIKSAREKRGLTQEELGAKCGTTKQTIFKYETGVVTNIPTTRIQQIADVLQVSPAYLMGWESEDSALNIPNIFKIETKKFPLLGNIACGEPVFASEEMGLYIEAGANIHADFCLKASGDSMIGARIHDGDIVFIRQQSSVNNGEIAAVLIDDEATLKRIYYDPDSSTISLFAENPAYKTLRFHGAELDNIRILGKAVAFQSDIR